jgi:ribosomal protein L37AE/L43A
MRIKEITSQHRRDFWAIFECEHCAHEEKKSGYDDRYFHEKVVPRIKCPKCGKTAGESFRPMATKYPEGFQV